MAGESSKTTVILTTSADWREWIEVTKTAAEGHGVWDHMDPDKTSEQILSLNVPLEPQPQEINPAKTQIAQLDEAEEKRLRMRKKDYREELREYKEKHKGIGLLRTRIQETVARTNLHYTFNKNTVYDILVQLKERFAPDDETRERDLELQYESLKHPPRDSNIESWLQRWEGTNTEARRINLSNVEGNRAVRDFIRAAKTFAPGWSEYWANYRRSNPSTTPDLYGIIQNLREYRRDQGSDTHVRSLPAFATFKGKGIEDSGSTSIHLSSPSTAPQSTTHHSKP